MRTTFYANRKLMNLQKKDVKVTAAAATTTSTEKASKPAAKEGKKGERKNASHFIDSHHFCLSLLLYDKIRRQEWQEVTGLNI
jgi:hypothetical protein